MKRLDEVTADDFEWSAEIERLLYLDGARPSGEAWGIRVRYRQRSTRRGTGRRWTTFLLVPQPGDTFEQVAGTVAPAIVAHFRRLARVPA